MNLSSKVRIFEGRLQVKTGTLAELLGLTSRAIQKQVAAGVLPNPGPQAWHDAATAVQAYIAYASAGRTDPESVAAARERLTRAQAIRVEMENELRRGEQVRVSIVAELFYGLAADLASRLDGLSGRVASELAGMTSAAEIRALLLRECRLIRNGVAEHIGKLAGITPNDADDADAPAATEPPRSTVSRLSTRIE